MDGESDGLGATKAAWMSVKSGFCEEYTRRMPWSVRCTSKSRLYGVDFLVLVVLVVTEGGRVEAGSLDFSLYKEWPALITVKGRGFAAGYKYYTKVS